MIQQNDQVIDDHEMRENMTKNEKDSDEKQHRIHNLDEHHAGALNEDHQEPHHITHTSSLRKKQNPPPVLSGQLIALLVVAILLVIFNQYQIALVSAAVGSPGGGQQILGITRGSGEVDLAAVDANTLKSTGQTVAAVFPVQDFATAEDAMASMFPTGTPDYGTELGVSFDDPVGSLSKLSRMYRSLQSEVQTSSPEGWKHFMSLASKPVGISCEYCCGVGPIGIDANGNSACGCQHNPALLSIALYLSAYTDYTDGEILQEVMKWKTLFFPQNMIELGMKAAGGDPSALKDLPGMVGGC